MKRLMAMMVAAIGVAAFAAAPTITNVKARQRYPWNGMVDIDYTVSGDTTGMGLSISIRDVQNSKTYQPTKFLSALPTVAGTHRVTWSTEADGVAIVSTNVIATVSLLKVADVPPVDKLYCVIDLSEGPNAENYPVTYLSAIPGGEWSDEYKTTKLVLRKIPAGADPLGRYTISKDFYVGVFEVTQKQYERVMGTNPSSCKGDKRAVERVSYNMIRGDTAGALWPASDTVESTSFLGRLRARTGVLTFDLPTEGQWEYVCRAGTTSTYNNGGSTEADLKTLGRYSDNKNDGRGGGYTSGTVFVGSYAPNAWGLYDCHGNVYEWCRDWLGGSLVGTDPSGASSGAARVLRGGSWNSGASYCASSYRNCDPPSDGYDYRGFRLVCSAGL